MTYKQAYLVTVPYLDIHETSYSGKVLITFGRFQDLMLRFAEQWGDKALGHQLRRGITVEGVTNMRTDKNHLVLAIGKYGERKFIVISKGVHTVDFIEHDWNNDWNVTKHKVGAL